MIKPDFAVLLRIFSKELRLVFGVVSYINITMAKPKAEDASEDAKKIVDDAKNFIDKAIADIGRTSATKQLILGTASGWYVVALLLF